MTAEPQVDRDDIQFATIEEALEDIAAGKMIVVVDDEDRENEGDVVMAAEFTTADDINFMTRQAGGWICLTLTPERCEELGLELMSSKNESAHETPFTVTIEAREGVTTGISTADQATTIRTAVDPGQGQGRHRRPRPRPSAQGPQRRRAGAHGPHRGLGRPRAPGRLHAGRRHLRGPERGRLDGARRRSRRLLPQARLQDDHDRRSDRLPAPPRQARRARRVDHDADGLRRLHGRRLPLAGRREAPRRDGQGRGRRARRTCWSACTPSASPATSSTRCAATAASSWSRRCR